MTHPDIQIVSTIVETHRFTVPGIPEVLGGQNGKVRVWDSRNTTLFTEFTVFFRDDSIAEIVYVYPSSIKSTSNEIVEVSIKRLGAASDPVDIFVAHDVSCDSGRSSQGHGSICTLSSLSNAAIANYRGSILRIAPANDGLTVEFTVNNTKNDVAMINVTIVNRKFCPSQDELKAGNCRKKSRPSPWTSEILRQPTFNQWIRLLLSRMDECLSRCLWTICPQCRSQRHVCSFTAVT